MAQQKDINRLLTKLNNTKTDTSRLAILSHLSSAYAAVAPNLTHKYACDLKRMALKTGRLKETADADILLGISWGIRSRYDSSLYYFRQSLVQAEKIKYDIGVADAYINIGEVFSRLGDDLKASTYYLKALPLFEKSKYLHGINLCFTNLGDIFTAQKSYQVALNYYNRSLINYRSSKNLSEQPSVLNNIADCYLHMRKFDKALNTYHVSLKISEEVGNLWSEAYIYSGMGAVYTDLHLYEKALANLFRSEKILDTVNDNDLLATVYQRIANSYLKNKKFGLSKSYALKSLSISIKVKSKAKTSDAFQILSAINKEEGNFKAAYKYQSDYLSYRDAILNDGKLKSVSLLSLERSQMENTSLTKDNGVKAALLEKNMQRINLYHIIFSLGLLILLLVALQALLLNKSNRQKKAYNELLERQRHEIAGFNEKLRAINEELTAQMAIVINQNRELERINEMKSKLYAVVSHDFRSPLSTLKSLMVLSENGDITQEEMPGYLHEVSSMVDHTFIFLENLLAWSKSQMDGIKSRPAAMDVRKIIFEKIALFSVQAKMKGISLTADLPETLIVFADESMIRLVIRNLLANAIKFTGKGGKITFNAESTSTEVTIAIKDTGTGMSDDVLTKLFNTSYTSPGTAHEKGSGLGLMMCYEFISHNNGRIWAESIQGMGSTFYFSLPIYT